MKKQEELYNTIHSLDSHELRYFRLFAQRHTDAENSASLKLFDIILADANIDDRKLTVTHKIKNLARAKQYLLLMVHKALFQYHDNETWQAKIKRYARMAEVFLDKGEYEIALENLDRAFKVAARFNASAFLPALQEIGFAIRTRSGGTLNMPPYPLVNAEENKSLMLMQELSESRLWLEEMKAVNREVGSYKNTAAFISYDKIYSNVQNKLKSGCQNPESEILLVNALVIYHFNHSEHEKYYVEIKKILALYESRPDLILKDEFRYLVILQNFLNCCIRTKRVQELEKYVPVFRNYKTNSYSLKEYIFIRYFNLSVYRFLEFNECEKIYELLPYIKTSLAEFKLGNRYILGSLYFLTAICLANVQDFRESLKWINKIISSDEFEDVVGAFDPAMLINVVAKYELNEIDSLLSNLRTFKGIHAKRKAREEYEKIIISRMMKICQISANEKRADLFEKMAEELETELHLNNEKVVVYGFDFVGWCKKSAKKLKSKNEFRRKRT